MPIGISEEAYVRTSKFVKSGSMNLSFSKSFDQGSNGMILGASSINYPNRFVDCLFTSITMPSHSPLVPKGSA